MSLPVPRLRIAVLALAFSCAAYADKKIVVQITHPAEADAVLAGRQLLPGTQTGACADELAMLILRDIAGHGVAVVRAEEAAKALERQKLPGTAIAGDAAFAALERAFGPIAVLSIDITRCDVRQREPLMGPGMPAIRISRTEGHINGTLRIVAPTDAKLAASIELRADANKENHSQSAAPEYPGTLEVKEATMLQALAQSRKLYAPWRESREVVFYDDKACDMKQAYDAFQAKQFAEMLSLAKQGVESCTSGKTAANAWYNLGVAYLASAQVPDAVAAFEKAQQVRDTRPAAELLSELKRVAEAMKRAPAANVVHGPAPAAASDQPAMILTNDFIVKLLRGAVDADTIVAMIGNNGGRYTLDDASIAELKKAGASDAVLDAMRKKK